MAYIGNNLTVQQYSPQIAYFSGNGSATTFTLPQAVVTSAQILIAVDNVIQNPSSAYTVSGTTLTFTSAPLSGTNNIWVIYTSLQTQLIAPSQGTVGPSQINSAYALWNLSGSNINYTAGNVGIGTNAPVTTLSIGSGAGAGGYGGGVYLNRGAATYNFYEANDGTNSVIFGLDNNVSNAKIGTVNSFPVALYVGNSPRLYIDTSGNVGINTTSQGSKLEIKASGASGTQLQLTQYNSTDGWKINADDNGGPLRFIRQGASLNGEAMRIENSGYVDIGCTSNRGGSTLTLSMDSGTTRWAVGPWVSNAGQFYVASSGSTGVYLSSTSATSWSSNSDERIKENLVPITDALNKVSTLRTVTGNYIEDETKTSHAFLIAQDILPVLPEAVDTSNPEKYGVAYTEVIPLMVAAIKELKAEVDALKAQLEAK